MIEFNAGRPVVKLIKITKISYILDFIVIFIKVGYMYDNLFSKRGVSLERLKTFLEVAQAGSIVGAAGGDCVRQSQYSRQIKELEEFFGTALADRRGKFLRITPAGKKLANIISHSFSGLSDLKNECSRTRYAFSIGGMDSVLEWVVGPLISRAASKNIKWTFSFERLRNVYSYSKLLNMQLDMAVITKDAVASDIISFKEMGRLSYSVYIHKKNIGKISCKRGEEAKFILETFPAVSLIDEYDFSKLLKSQFEAFSITPNIVLKVHTFQFALKLIESGDYVGILPKAAESDMSENVAGFSAPFLKTLDQKIVLAWNRRVMAIRPEMGKVVEYIMSLQPKR